MNTRIAPSPTGAFHLGTARTAYFNYLAAKATGGKFILRIDDTDLERNKEEYVKIIFDSLEWLGLEPDEIYYQSKRTQLYVSEAKGLLNQGKAIVLNNGAIALKLPEMPKAFIDTISGAIPITETNHAQIDRKTILLRGTTMGADNSLGTPTYQFASVVDDYFIGVNWIIRGTDHITNTPKQIAIWNALNDVYQKTGIIGAKPLPRFSHVGLISYKEEDNGKPRKLSKRDNAASLLWYRDKGYSPESILDWMLRFGWGPKGDDKSTRFISKDQAIELFLKGNLRNSPAMYDLKKLDAFQKHYGGSNVQ
jgi:glutamyl-tRNA synthetase